MAENYFVVLMDGTGIVMKNAAVGKIFLSGIEVTRSKTKSDFGYEFDVSVFNKEKIETLIPIVNIREIHRLYKGNIGSYSDRTRIVISSPGHPKKFKHAWDAKDYESWEIENQILLFMVNLFDFTDMD